MKNYIYVENFITVYNYPGKEVYAIANKFGKQLINYLGSEKILLLLDSKLLMLPHSCNILDPISNRTYKLHPAAKALEGFLQQLIKLKKLKEDNDDKIGNVFGDKNNIIKKKIKNKKLLLKAKYVWEFCRNEIMHYPNNIKVGEEWKKFDEILDVILELYIDFYGKSEPDEEINKGFNRYFKL